MMQCLQNKILWPAPLIDRPLLLDLMPQDNPARSRAFKELAESHVQEVTLGAGDMLFLPEGWWHQVSRTEALWQKHGIN